MKQVLVIHGGNSFATYEEYLEDLRTYTPDLSYQNKIGWKKQLQEKLGEHYQVILPTMPNKQNAKYEEWKIVFESYIPLLAENLLLVGHSLGGSFLVKYLAEESFPKKIEGLFLVAAPYDEGSRALLEFLPNGDLSRVEQQVESIYIYHSKDDSVVPFEEAEKYQEKMPTAHMKTFEDREHFNDEVFPELVEDIQNLT